MDSKSVREKICSRSVVTVCIYSRFEFHFLDFHLPLDEMTSSVDALVFSVPPRYHVKLHIIKTGLCTPIKFRSAARVFLIWRLRFEEVLWGCTELCCVISCEGREKVVLWFGCGPPCLWLPVNQSANLTADTIPASQPFVSSRTAIIIYPSFYQSIFLFFWPQWRGTWSVYLSDYGFLFNKRLVFRKAGHLLRRATHTHTVLLRDCSIYSPCTGDDRW